MYVDDLGAEYLRSHGWYVVRAANQWLARKVVRVRQYEAMLKQRDAASALDAIERRVTIDRRYP